MKNEYIYNFFKKDEFYSIDKKYGGTGKSSVHCAICPYIGDVKAIVVHATRTQWKSC